MKNTFLQSVWKMFYLPFFSSFRTNKCSSYVLLLIQRGQELRQSLRMWTLPQGIQCTSLAELKAILNQKLSGFETSKFKRGSKKLDISMFIWMCVCFWVHVHMPYGLIYGIVTSETYYD